MKINLLTVGKLKEPWLKQGVEHYSRRLKRWARVSVTDVAEQPLGDKDVGARSKTVARESSLVLERIVPGTCLIVLDICGRKMNSEQLAGFIQEKKVSGFSDFTFVIGGSMGLNDEVRAKADLLLSFSGLTFPHQLMRVMLLEQIYRAHKILAGETYHK